MRKKMLLVGLLAALGSLTACRYSDNDRYVRRSGDHYDRDSGDRGRWDDHKRWDHDRSYDH